MLRKQLEDEVDTARKAAANAKAELAESKIEAAKLQIELTELQELQESMKSDDQQANTANLFSSQNRRHECASMPSSPSFSGVARSVLVVPKINLSRPCSASSLSGGRVRGIQGVVPKINISRPSSAASLSRDSAGGIGGPQPALVQPLDQLAARAGRTTLLVQPVSRPPVNQN